MSMIDNGFEVYGIAFTCQELDDMYNRVVGKQESHSHDGGSVWGSGYELYDLGIVDYESEFSGSAEPALWGVGYSLTPYCSEPLFYVALDKQPTLFGAAYANVGEAAEEIKDKIGKYLPCDFDYEKRICHIFGSYYG